MGSIPIRLRISGKPLTELRRGAIAAKHHGMDMARAPQLCASLTQGRRQARDERRDLPWAPEDNDGPAACQLVQQLDGLRPAAGWIVPHPPEQEIEVEALGAARADVAALAAI